MGEADTTVDALHSDSVLLVLVKATEDIEQLSLRHLWNQFDHVVENNGGLLSNLGSLVLGNRIINCHNLLLTCGANVGVHTGEELHGRKLRRVTLSIHQTLDHAHDAALKIFYPDRLQDFFDALCCLKIYHR